MNCVYRILNRWVKASSLERTTERFALDCRAVAQTLSETTQAEYTSELEAIEAEKATLITEPYIACDSIKEPILGYFPGALADVTVETTQDTLLEYLADHVA